MCPPKFSSRSGARFDGLIEVESRHRTRRAGHIAVAHRQHHRRAVVGLDQARRHDPHDALHPARVVDHRALQSLHGGVALDEIVRLLRDGAVDRLAVLVVGVDHAAELRGDRLVALDQQLDGGVAARGEAFSSFSSIRIRPAALMRGPILKTMSSMVMLCLSSPQILMIDSRPFRWLAVEVLQAEIGQNAVFAHQRHDVRGDAHHQQVQQRADLLEGNAVFLGVGLHELESHAAARQFVERVGTIDPLGVQNGYGLGNFLGREVMVADDEIHAFRFA